MQDEILKARKTAKGTFICFAIISQIIFVAVMLITVLIIKFANKGLYQKVKTEYQKRFSVETTVQQMLDEVDIK